MSKITNKILFSLGLVFSGIFFYSIYSIEVYCRSGAGDCLNAKMFEALWMYSIIFVPVLLFSILYFFLNNKGFNLFRNVTTLLVLIHVVLISLLPSECQDYIKICKESFALILPITYTLISLILIAYKSYKLRGK